MRVAILRALRDSLGYSHKTWILRISRSSGDAISVICAGHYALFAAHTPLAWYQISTVARIASWIWLEHYYGFRAPGAVSVMTARGAEVLWFKEARGLLQTGMGGKQSVTGHATELGTTPSRGAGTGQSDSLWMIIEIQERAQPKWVTRPRTTWWKIKGKVMTWYQQLKMRWISQ